MNAFQNSEAIRDAFCQASTHIANGVGSREYLIAMRDKRMVRDLIHFLLKDYVSTNGPQLSYDQLELPDNVILLMLGILRALPAKERAAWLHKFFKSIAVGADLDERQIWPRYIKWLLLRRMPRPTPGGRKDRDRNQLLRRARLAVKGVIGLIFQDTYDPDAWSAAGFVIDDIKRSLRSCLEARGESHSIMGGDHPALAPVYFALALIIQRRDEGDFFFIDSIVNTAAMGMTPIDRQSVLLLKLLLE